MRERGEREKRGSERKRWLGNRVREREQGAGVSERDGTRGGERGRGGGEVREGAEEGGESKIEGTRGIGG